MYYNGCSGNFPSCSLGGYLRCPDSFQPSNLVYSTDLCSPRTCLLGSSLLCSCQEISYEPIRFQTSCVVSFSCQTSCYRPRTSRLCSSCWTTYAGCLAFKSSSCLSLSSRHRSCCSMGFGSHGFRPLGYGVCGFPSLGCGSRFWNPIKFPSMSFCSSCYWPICRSGFY
ncbi:PREDICTED: keratin-associated protein 13-1-like [Lipotes vexillifer]|uniref:Keratin-associated protein n=1 Tax=Lipotes vexillifer TaxID=118797 RepID=A0A340X7D4_LIPVE|nr:PREDICTED: keratin-associated protein 13-1-like [Lipotes vexillifer]